MSITNPDIRDYIIAITPEREEQLERLYKEAVLKNIPIIKQEMEQFLTCMIKLHKPKRILEIGTAIGYSSIVMSRALEEVTLITTLEKSDKMIAQAKHNIEAFGYTDSITIIEGDAVETLKELDGSYDLIFMDAAKGQYMNFYNNCIRLLKKDGVLIADNILQDGLVAKSRYAIPRRQRTIHARMRTFIHTVSHSKLFATTVLAIGDGATISVKLK